MTLKPATPKSETFNEVLTALILAALCLAWLASLLKLPGGPLAWLILRSSGTLAYLALAISTSLGALLSSKYAPNWLNRAAQYGWHGLLSGFALSVSMIHGLFLMVDAQYRQPLVGVMLPFASSFKPLEIGLGTLTVYALLTVYISTIFKNRLSARTWRVLHVLSYPAFIFATIHGIFAGSDSLLALYWMAGAAVLLTFALRINEVRTKITTLAHHS
jgi:methionine sulfoxide reductase heme-binding subunit